MAGAINHDIINENDNNNGPISPADLQNIENNNAGEYIPNLNQILAPAPEPIVVAPQPLLEQFGLAPHLPLVSAEVQAQSGMPLAIHSGPISPTNSHQQANDTNPFLDDQMAVYLSDIRIDVDEDCCTEVPLLGARSPMFSSKPISGIQAMFGGLSSQRSPLEDDPTEDLQQPTAENIELTETRPVWDNTDMYSTNNLGCIERGPTTFTSDEAKNVEEALLALDFAISGAEAMSDDESEDDSDDAVSDQLENSSSQPVIDEIMPDILPNPDVTKLEKENDNEEFMNDVCAAATHLVDSVLELSLEAIIEKLEEQKPKDMTFKNEAQLAPIFNEAESDRTVVVKSLEASSIEGDNNVDASADDSLIEFNFEQMAIEASTPFVHKQPPINATTFIDETPVRKTRVSQNLFGIEQPAKEAELDKTWCAPIAADATFDAAPKTALETADATFTAVDATFIAANATFTAANATFTAANATFTAPVTSDQTFTETMPKLPQANLPEIRISPDSDIASVDLTTATPVNTPIELNYSVDGWDTFITNSMKKPVQSELEAGAQASSSSLKPSDGAGPAGPSGDATFPLDDIQTSGWFLHPSDQQDDVAGGGWEDNDCDDDQCEDGDLLSLTFDSLRKQLTEALPHAQGAMSCSATTELPEVSDDPEELMNNDFDLENR